MRHDLLHRAGLNDSPASSRTRSWIWIAMAGLFIPGAIHVARRVELSVLQARLAPLEARAAAAEAAVADATKRREETGDGEAYGRDICALQDLHLLPEEQAKLLQLRERIAVLQGREYISRAPGSSDPLDSKP